MKLGNIIDAIEGLGNNGQDKADRRGLLRSWSKAGLLLATSMAITSKAHAEEDKVRISDAMNVILDMAHLISEYYSAALRTEGLIPTGKQRQTFLAMYADITGHIGYMKGQIIAMGGKPVDVKGYDFSGGQGTEAGPFENSLSDYNIFLELAQLMEDIATGSFKSQVGNFTTSRAVVESAFNMHSINARHAAHIRSLRKALGVDVEPWITMYNGVSDREIDNEVYHRESTAIQLDFTITEITKGKVSANRSREAFDDEFNTGEVIAFIRKFVIV